MKIIVNHITFQNGSPQIDSYIDNIFQLLVKRFPEHHFCFLVLKNHHSLPSFNAPNVSVITINEINSINLWRNIKLPLLLRKLKADVVVQANGICCFNTGIPQVLLISDCLWLNKPTFIPTKERLYYRLFMAKSMKKAKCIIAISQNVKDDLSRAYPIATEKIKIVYPAANTDFQPIFLEKKREIKDGFAEGREYFLFTEGNNPIKNVVAVLKAFSLFKKWQKSNMKLLITGLITPQKNDVLDKLSSYKYKDDVVILSSLNEQQKSDIIAAAYCCILPSHYEGFATTVLSCLQSGIPVIASDIEGMKEAGGDACIYTLPDDVEDIANQMKLLYRDEQHRNVLIPKGFEQATKFSWENSTVLFWETLRKASL